MGEWKESKRISQQHKQSPRPAVSGRGRENNSDNDKVINIDREADREERVYMSLITDKFNSRMGYYIT